MRQPQKSNWFKHVFLGAILGAVVIMILGFGWWGWTLGSTAEHMAQDRADSAVATIVVPLCVQSFTTNPEKLTAFRKTNKWSQSQFVEESGFATPPGFDRANKKAASACAEKLAELKG